MKASVLRNFRDKGTKKIYKTGDVYEGSKERIAEINAFGKNRPFLQVAVDGVKEEGKNGKEGA